ncbi:MAG: TetR/AcrR family transcriptional regulator [Thiolinea sp.]
MDNNADNTVAPDGPAHSATESGVRLTREDWVRAALQIFAEKGIDAVRIEPLAQSLKVTKGSFYWHFKNRRELHQAIIDHWSRRCTSAITRCLREEHDIIAVVLNVFAMWMRDEPFSPRLDAAMRDWARRSDNVRQAVLQADYDRTRAIARVFERAGYPQESALIRARILYFGQIGYYEANLQESRAVRIDLWREYVKVITGLDLSQERLTAFRDQHFTAEELRETTLLPL